MDAPTVSLRLTLPFCGPSIVILSCRAPAHMSSIQWPYREGSQLPRDVFHLRGHYYHSLGRIWASCPLRKYNGFALKPLRFTQSPWQPGTHPLSGSPDVWREVVLPGIGLKLWLPPPCGPGEVAKVIPPSLRCVQGNGTVKKEQGPSRGTSGTFIFLTRVENTGACRPSW